ncbi:hypothetical protein [Conchiformibius kuhniae]|uniref:Uncharacterized protein n=1 Tax=Conchiformibius kuhniae TaxID=211502 RepID=A0A8T9MTW2_9NEIS|nr:hypothetical protein [Conchiformibius kuhniae]UOP05320.1 hypothetical protein LVJ77_03740 [Conchiformibius kuhniae]
MSQTGFTPDFAGFWRLLSAAEKRDFAARCGCHYNQLSAFSGGRQIPSLRLAAKMKEAADGALDDADLRPLVLLEKLRLKQRT